MIAINLSNGDTKPLPVPVTGTRMEWERHLSNSNEQRYPGNDRENVTYQNDIF